MFTRILVFVCVLAMAVSAGAQLDDLDALLSGLGDELAVEEVAETVETEIVDPFADLLGEVEEAAEDIAEAVETEIEDPFADLLAGADIEEAVAEPELDDPFADLMADADLEEVAEVPDLDDLLGEVEETVEDITDAVETDIEDPFADLMTDADLED
ncbi:MAG: hypothetical protein GX803_08190, partial [Lentisphaerae bacterium]|nr:hypothetical protein [Lentisphaerota bacterium]